MSSIRCSEFFSVLGSSLEEASGEHCWSFEEGDHWSQDILTPIGFLLALKAALGHCYGDSFSWSGIVCSSWGFPARSCSGRTGYRPYGYMHKATQDGNAMLFRMMLLWLVLVLHGTQVALEQPGSSTLPSTLVFRAMRRLLRLRRAFVWQGGYGHSSPKPTVLWGDCSWLVELCVPFKKEMVGVERVCTKWWDDIDQRWGCCGANNMKSFQHYLGMFGRAIADKLQSHRNQSITHKPLVVECSEFIATHSKAIRRFARLHEVDAWLAVRS